MGTLKSEVAHVSSDCWYAVAWSYDVLSVPLERTICVRSLVLFRRFEWQVAALSGFARHRFASWRAQIAPLRKFAVPLPWTAI